MLCIDYDVDGNYDTGDGSDRYDVPQGDGTLSPAYVHDSPVDSAKIDLAAVRAALYARGAENGEQL